MDQKEIDHFQGATNHMHWCKTKDQMYIFFIYIINATTPKNIVIF